jgi:hypothetical protein
VAEDLTRTTPGPEPGAQEAFLGGPSRSEEDRVHRLRFAVAYLALAVVAGIAVGAGVLLARDDARVANANWSSWQPEGDTAARPKLIADHVAERYTHPDGSQLVLVFSGPPSVKTGEQDVPIRWIAIRSESGATEDTKVVETDNAVMYVLCGAGANCAMDGGDPTPARYRLLRRQALELALYSFKYTDAQSVIALLPPVQNPSGQPAEPRTLFFQEKDFDVELDRPLQLTLSRPDASPSPAEIDPREILTIDRLTRPRLFTYEYSQAQEGSAVMLLAPILATQ